MDDERIPLDVFSYKRNPIYTEKEWEIVRSFREFQNIINIKGLPELISFDHDLGDLHYKIGARSSFTQFDYGQSDGETGYDAAKWLCGYCLEKKQKLPKFLVHSMNPIGAKNIQTYLDNYSKYVDNENKSRE